MQGLGGGCRFWSPLRERAGRQVANRRRQTLARTPFTQEARRCDQEEDSSVFEFADGIGLSSAWHYPTLLNLLATSATEQQAVGETRVYRPVYMQKPVVLVMQVQSEQDWAELGGREGGGGNARGEHFEWRFNAQPFTLENSGFATRFEGLGDQTLNPSPAALHQLPWAWLRCATCSLRPNKMVRGLRLLHCLDKSPLVLTEFHGVTPPPDITPKC
ncbi:hypothetical protein V2G26_000959 [Clonostachys chloroleuca]